MEKTLREKVAAKLSAIKKVLAEEETPEAVALEDVKMIDGTILRIEPAIEVGATVQVIGEDAEMIEAPDGEHELESGDVIKTEGGVIIEIIAVEGEVEEVVEEEMSEDAPVEETAAPKLDVEALQNQLIDKLNTALTDKINNLKFASVKEVADLKAENATLKEALTDLVEVVEKFAATPTEEPKKKVNNPFKDKEKKEFDFSKIGQALRNTKNN
jgi:membrane-associated HD superfamily phosphohydrolase